VADVVVARIRFKTYETFPVEILLAERTWPPPPLDAACYKPAVGRVTR